MRSSPFHTRSKNTTPRGFTLVEIAVTILVMGMLFALSVPTVQSLSSSYQLKGATENLAAQLRLAREKAIATGAKQHFHMGPTYSATSYFIVVHPQEFIVQRWNLPRGISYYTTGAIEWNEMLPNGRSLTSGIVILQDRKGNRDTVSMLTSGLVLTK